MKSEKELKKAVKSEKISAGFDVKDDLNYEYYVLNRNMYDENQAIFESFLSQVHQQIYCEQNDLDYASFSAGYDAPVNARSVFSARMPVIITGTATLSLLLSS